MKSVAASVTLTVAPILRTERLVLRGPEMCDFEPLVEFYADEQRSTGFGGPIKREEAWRWFATNIGHWAIHGYGFWTVTTDSKVCGIVGLWFPEGWPEPELGWVMFQNAEGKGYAAEAALAVRAHAYDSLGFPTLTSLIVPDNSRSIRLAERLGCVREAMIDNLHMGAEWVYRHPAPKAAA
jgi:RimJ/RimL family protein N-acetyltransferase